MSDNIQLEFDLLLGKNEVNSALDGLKKNAVGASSSVDNLGKSTKKAIQEFGAIKPASDSLGSLGSNAKSVNASIMGMGIQFAAVSGVIASAVYAAKEFVGAAIESEENVSRLNVALKQTGLNSDTASKKFQDLASSIQETTIYSDDQVMALEAMLQNLGQFTEKGLEEATKASIELASAFKIDLSSAALLVGKAASGNVQAFQRMGIEIKKGKTDSETFANTLKELERFTGSSSEEIKTLGGSMKYLGNQTGEFAETAGFSISNLLRLKDASILVAKTIKDLNADIKDKPKEFAFDVAANSLGKFGLVLKTAKFAYKELVGEIEENPIKMAIQSENAISKLPIGTQKIFELPFDNGQKNPMLSDIAKVAKETNDLLLNTKARQEEVAKKNQEERDKIRKDFLSQIDQIKNAGKTQLEILEQEREARLRITKEAYSSGAISAKEALAARINTESEFQIKKAEIEKKYEEEKFKREKDIQDKLAAWINKQSEENKKNLTEGINKVAGFASNVMSGREGARSAISTGAGMVGDALLPGSGQAISMLTSQLSQGPEATKAMVREFAAAVPELIKAVVEAIPVLIEEFNKQLPKVVQALADLMGDPNFWVNFSKGMLKASVAAASAIPKAFIAAIPEFFDGFGNRLINAIADGFNQAIGYITDQLNPFDGGGDGLLGLGFLGLARGGQVQSVPSGFPNDTFPAMLSSGELVVDRSTVERLNDFMDNGQGGDASITDALLAKILAAVSNPQNINTSVTLNGREFANIILELSRNNARLAV